ncbi:hypothetical protein TcCL_Unassigned02226 [Trypanosoma cruzi]|nr:hypothetical protein TcCL_Unassigned02226 [Trypanosoma cruzi]
MSRDNSSQLLKYAARHSVNCLTVLGVVWCPPAVVIRSQTSVIGFDFMKKKRPPTESFPSPLRTAPRTPHQSSRNGIPSTVKNSAWWGPPVSTLTTHSGVTDVVLGASAPSV